MSSCSGTLSNIVDLKYGSCTYPDRLPEGKADKHIVAAKCFEAKPVARAGCGRRFSLCNLVAVREVLAYFKDTSCTGVVSATACDSSLTYRAGTF